MIKIIPLLTILLFSAISVFGQFSYEDSFDPLEQFATMRIEQDVFPARFGFALGLVDSVEQILFETGSMDTNRTINAVRYEGENMSFASSQRDTSGSYFIYEEYTIPIVAKDSGTSFYTYVLIQCYNSNPMGGGLTCDTNTIDGLLLYEDGMLSEKTIISSNSTGIFSSERIEYDFESGKPIEELGFRQDLSTGEDLLTFAATYTYNALGNTATYLLARDIDFNDGIGQLSDTTKHIASVNSEDRLDLSVDYGDDYLFDLYGAFSQNELDSFLIVDDAASGFPERYDFSRFDDGSDPRVRSYLLGFEGVFSLRTFYYQDAVSDSRELPLLEGSLVAANPIRSGLTHKIVGLTQPINLQIINAQGQVIKQVNTYQNGTDLTWEGTPAGSYFIVCRAPGYSPRAWPIIAQ
ncbi:MAG: T9SS type A sorting domain-containing protein [Saprospiraceae bacterium]